MNEEQKDLSLGELKQYSDKQNFDQIVSDLKAAFAIDATDEEACRYAFISPSTYYLWRSKSEDFCMQMDIAKDRLFMNSKRIIAKIINTAIDENGDIDLSKTDAETAKTIKWLLARRQKRIYGSSVEITGEGGRPFDSANQVLKEIAFDLQTLLKPNEPADQRNSEASS